MQHIQKPTHLYSLVTGTSEIPWGFILHKHVQNGDLMVQMVSERFCFAVASV